MFIRTKRDWKQNYFYLVESYRDKEGRPRQHSIYLGTTLNLSAQEWMTVLQKAEEATMYRGDIERAVRAFCKKRGLLPKTADAVRAAAKLLDEKEETEETEEMRRLLESMKTHAREPRRVRPRAVSSDMVVEAARVLGLSSTTTKEEVQAAFRKLASANHPDHGGDAVKFQVVVEARDTLAKHLGTT